MRLIKKVVVSKLRDPRAEFRETAQHIEIRQDPLTGMRCRINVERASRPHQVVSHKPEIEKPRDCPFCFPNIWSATPKFAGRMPERIRHGESVVFPNLYPFGEFHAVAVFSRKHFMQLNEFTPRRVKNCLEASLRALEWATKTQPELRYWHVNWNHLAPAGASIVHPHMQILATGSPTFFLKKVISGSRRYFRKHGANFWDELVKFEKEKGERYIGKTGRVHWLASFAPLGSKEILAIASGTSSLAAFRSLQDLCEGLYRVLKGFEQMGVESFNLSSYSAPCDGDYEFFRLHFRIIARPRPAQLYTNDSGFMERLQIEPVVDTLPELLAEEMRKFF